MDLEEPLEKVDAFTRGPKECKTVSGVRKPGEAENEEDSPGDDEMTNCKEEIKKTRVVYTRDVLNELRDSPASKLWPAFAEEDCVRNGIWDPEVWHHTPASAKRCASPVEDFKRQIQIEDGIVLSPQRQSFGQGCHVHQSAPERGLQQERTKSMISRTIERDTREGRNRLTGRVGRGSRSLDYRTNMRDRNRNGDRQASPWERNDKEQKRGRDDDSYNYKRGRRRHDEDEDPEWMTFGPTSISETIELRGFNKESISRQRGKTGSLTSSDGIPSPITIKDKNLKNQQDQEEQITPSADNKDKQDDDDDDDADFDINQFFTSDSFLQLGDEPEQSASNESRFRQFFGIGGKQGSQNGSRRSSGAEELLEYSGVSSPSTPHTPSPSQKFMFTPIKPIEANTKPESLSEMLEKTKLDVKPMLDTVLSSAKRDEMRIKGLKRLEEIEPDSNREQSMTATTEKASDENKVGDMTAFISLIEKMKTSGSLPEKPQPVIPGLPSHLLPRPPSPKTKTPRRSPSPLKDLDRSTSPVEFLHHIIQKQQSPSPPQVVPQMNRSYSPLETPLYKSVEKLRRSPSPIQSMYQQKPFSPLLTPDAFMSPTSGHPPYIHNRTNHMMYQVPDKPRFELPNETPKPVYQNQKQTPRSAPITKPKVTPKTQSAALKDLGFMPTSVLQKIKKDQMTPKSKADGENGPKESSNISFESMKMNGPVIEQIGRHTVPAGFTSPDSKRGMALSKDDQLLLKPTAFKPYQGTSPHSVSPHRSGIHSEPQSPQVRPAEGRKDPLPSSAPVTPQRHPQTDRQLLVNLEARVREAANEKPIKLIKTSEVILPGRPLNMVDKPPSSYNKNSHFGNEMMMSHSKRDFEQTMPLSHSIHHQQQQQQQQQQQMRRENVQYLANMGRPRQTPPLAMMGGHSQSILGTPGMPRTPFPVPNMHHGKPHFHHPGMLSSQSLQPGNFRMMPPTRTPSGLPLQSPTSLMQMMPQRHPMMYRHGHTPLHGHPGYPQMMTSHGNFPMQRPHPGFVHQQAKVPNMPSPDNSARQSPSNDNALSKWFSDDVLRGIQSTTPKIPTEIGSKKIMSVEDLERQQALCTS